MSKQIAPFYIGQAKYTPPGKAMKSIFRYIAHIIYQIQGMKWSNVVIVRNGTVLRVLVYLLELS